MYEDKIDQIYRLKHRIIELELRIKNHSRWTSGEIEMYSRQIKSYRKKLKELDINPIN